MELYLNDLTKFADLTLLDFVLEVLGQRMTKVYLKRCSSRCVRSMVSSSSTSPAYARKNIFPWS